MCNTQPPLARRRASAKLPGGGRDMPRRPRLSSLLPVIGWIACAIAAHAVGGCAEERLIVPESDWSAGTAPLRTQGDRASDADLKSARSEAAAAAASLADYQRSS